MKNGGGVGEWMKYKRVCKEVGRRKLRIKDMKCKRRRKKQEWLKHKKKPQHWKEEEEEMETTFRFLVAILQGV